MNITYVFGCELNSSWKIGAVSGLIAGIVAGLMEVLSRYSSTSGFFNDTDGLALVSNAYEVIVLIVIIYGIIGGLIYSGVYNLIPGKAVLKGFIYGLVLYGIAEVRTSTFCFAYGWYLWASEWLLFGAFKWISYGLVLGLVYELLQRRYYPRKEILKIETYSMKSGILPGAIAGIIGGSAAALANIVGPMIGFFKIPGAPPAPTLDFLIGQAGSHIFINMVWGTIFGTILFTKVYNLVPSKGIVKGLIFGLTVFLMDSFQITMYNLGCGLKLNIQSQIFFFAWTDFVGFFQALFFGLVLGLLYRKPSD
jgi:hypothetical protein